MNQIILAGCSQSSLTGYLKALGVLRLLATQADNHVRGFWKDGNFALRTPLSRGDLASFFLDTYTPSPIISPWSGRAGFLEGDEGGTSNRKGAITIRRVEDSRGQRFRAYRSVIAAIRRVSVIQHLDSIRAESKQLEKLKKAKRLDQAGLDRLSKVTREARDLKDALLLALRGELEDDYLPWLDACFALTLNERHSAPLLGSGGNEGSMDFSINHLGYLFRLIDENTDKPEPAASQLLDNSLFGATGLLDSASNIGFLDSRATGGVNMTVGFSAESSGNTWDSVLAMEGAVLFASATTRKLGSTQSGSPSFPFTVSATLAGEGSLATGEKAQPELWLPVWSAAVSLMELSALLAEGRATLGRRQVRNGLDMLRALSSLGINRGITEFERFGFYERRGKGYFVATRLGTRAVSTTSHDNWIVNDLTCFGWLDKYRQFTNGKHAAARFTTLRKRLEDRLFALSGREPGKAEVQSLLILLGEIQTALSTKAQGTRKPNEDLPPPIPRLSERWVVAADDEGPTFRIAKALAGLKGTTQQPLPLRAQLFPVERKRHRWVTPESGEKYRVFTGQRGRLVDTLRHLLGCRLWLAEQLEIHDKPLNSPAGAKLEDIETFLRDAGMDKRIAELLPGLALCAIPQDTDRTAGDGVVPAAFALLKLCLTPDRILASPQLELLPEGEHLPVPPGMLALLAAGNHGNRALEIAWRRLRASGLSPLFAINGLPAETSIDPRRAAATLLIPLRFGATAALARGVLKHPEAERATETT